MGTPAVDPVDLMAAIIAEHTPRSIWVGSPLEGYRRLGNTNRGQIGEDFIRRYLAAADIPVSHGSRVTPTDLRIGSSRFEVKTASLGANGTFQFNHIRLDRAFNYLLCLGIAPRGVCFLAWRKGVVSEGGAGSLVRMAEGQSTTHKLTKRLADMRPIEEFALWVRRDVMGELDQAAQAPPPSPEAC